MRLTGAALIFLFGCATAGGGTDDDDDDNPPSDGPQQGQATLVVEKQGSGVGSVTSSPPGTARHRLRIDVHRDVLGRHGRHADGHIDDGHDLHGLVGWLCRHRHV